MSQGNISCTDKFKVTKQFYYNYSVSTLSHVEHRMTIYASSNYSDPDFFELTAKEINQSTLKISSITKNSDSLYGAKGIPDAAIPELAAISGKTIISSSNTHKSEPNEYRTDDATKFWSRLVKNGRASYDSSIDLYTYT